MKGRRMGRWRRQMIVAEEMYSEKIARSKRGEDEM